MMYPTYTYQAAIEYTGEQGEIVIICQTVTSLFKPIVVEKLLAWQYPQASLITVSLDGGQHD